MYFRVLGPLEVLDGHRRVPLGGPKQRALLANLLACPGNHLTTAGLIAAVYGLDAAPSVKRSIHTYVSNLRHEIGGVIVRRGDGYALSIEGEAVDAVVYEQEHRAGIERLPGEPEAAAHHLRAALALWRGHPYSGVDGSPAVDAEVYRLTELRVSTLQARVDADLALGRHQELIGELEGLIVENPFNEHFVGRHMLALYRAGRQREALRALARTRRVLAEELGVEPGPELERLEDSILRHDPSLDLAPQPRVERRAIVVSELPDELRTARSSERDQLLAERDAHVDLVLAERGGELVGLRGTAAYVAVSNVGEALEAARVLLGESLRIAVDFGDVEIEEGQVTGPPLRRAARLVAASHPGQVVLSQAAHDALNASGQAGWSVRSLGRHRIDGVDEPMMIYQVAGEGFSTSFPPLNLDRPSPPLPLGRPNITGYELREPLVDDGHSVLYRAYQHTVGRQVTLRAFRPELASDSRFVRRFEAEAQRLAALDHPHVLPVIDYWREPERAVIVSRATSERGRAEALESMRDPDAALGVVAQIGAGLAHAHGAGLVHGALTLDSLTFDEDHNPYLAGLGIASITHGLGTPSIGGVSAPGVETVEPTIASDMRALALITRDLLGEEALAGPVRLAVERAAHPDPSASYAGVRPFLEALAGTGRVGGPMIEGHPGVRNPYKGLNPFLEPDATDFFGRDELVATLVSYVDSGSLTLVVGPSGIGKSSAVRAGLVPALRSGSLPGSEGWLYTDMYPGSDPFDALRMCLSRVASRSPGEVVESMRTGETTLLDAAADVVRGETIVIIVDQLEELFTHVTDDEMRDAFLALLAELARTPPSRARVVATLRADFFDRPLEAADFGRAIADRVVAVHALSRDELTEVIRRPAESVGVHIDEDLVKTLAQDAARQPGGLPLLQQTLVEMFEQRSADGVTLADYHRSGGLQGSIGRRAEETYLGLSPEARVAARDAFLRMVTVDEESEDTRRRVRVAELDQLSYGSAPVAESLDAFGRHRLLTFDRDPASRGPTVEVAHEAILREWERVREWIDAVRDDLLVRRRVDAASREWDGSGREASYLLTGTRLEQAEAWQARTPLELTEIEREFLAESRRVAQAEVIRVRRIRRRIVMGLSGGLVVVSLLGVLAALQGRSAQRRAVENRVAELTNEALVSIDEDPDLAILLALEAYDTAQGLDDVPPEVVAALHQTVHESRLDTVIDDGAEVFSASPDGGTVALHAREDPATLRTYGLDTGDLIRERRLEGPIGGIDHHPDGSRITVTYRDDDSSGRPAMSILDAATLDVVLDVEGGGSAFGLTHSDDGRFVTGVDLAGATRIWDASTGYIETRLEGPAFRAAFVPGTSILARSLDDTLELIDAATGDILDRIPLGSGGYENVAAHPDGELLAVTNWIGDRIDLVDRSTGRISTSIGGLISPQIATFTRDGTAVAMTSTAPFATMIELETLERIELAGHGARTSDVEATDQHVLVQSMDQGLHVWRTGPRTDDGSFRFDTGEVFVSVVAPDGDRAAGVVLLPEPGAARVMLVEIATNRVIGEADFQSRPWDWPLLSPDGRFVVGRRADTGRGAVVDLTTGNTVLELRPCETGRAVNGEAGVVLVMNGCAPHEQEDPQSPPRVGVVNIAGGRLVLDLADETGGFDLAAVGDPGTPAEDLLVVARHPWVEVWRISTGRRLTAWQPPGIVEPFALPVWFSHGGESVLVTYQQGLLAVFDTRALQGGASMAEAERFVVQAHSGAAGRVQAAGDHVVTSSSEVRLWDVNTGAMVLEIDSLSSAVALTPDGSAAYYETAGGVMRKLPLDPEEVADLARSRVTRGFTSAECLRFLDPGTC